MKKLCVVIILAYCQNLFSNSLKMVLETGAVWQHRNDVQIPSESGTRLEFDSFHQDPFFHYRAEVYWNFTRNHNLRLLYAPFRIHIKGTAPTDIFYVDKTFSSLSELELIYQFNSYRFTYFYSYWGLKDKQLNLGITGKIRDAEIIFIQGSQKAAYDNIGFVPLIYFEYQTPLSSTLLFNFNIDAAAAPQGRAFDVSLKLRKKISQKYSIGFGARTLEGGAENEKVYTFSWFNYATLEFIGYF